MKYRMDKPFELTHAVSFICCFYTLVIVLGFFGQIIF